MSDSYEMTISSAIVDKLGVDLYDRASAVITELLSNAYDADATEVEVRIPLGKRLGWKEDGKIVSSDYTVEVIDNGHGMSPDHINKWYLFVGLNRRKEKNRARSPKYDRPVMGRKGIGKFAPFGICRRIEIISAGGKARKGKYQIAHLILNYDDIVKEAIQNYEPDIGPEDRNWVDECGTKIILSDFMNRTVPDAETFRRMLARRFGLSQKDFKIFIIDTSPDVVQERTELSPLDIPLRKGTKIDLIDFEQFVFDGVHYPISGWVAYADKSYRDEAMTGIRLYVRHKMAAAIRDFHVESGFTGEFNLRSYMVGEMHAEWLDEDDSDDLIRTHRQDIQWGSDIGRAFKIWGQKLVKKLAKDSYKAVKKKKSDQFLEKSKLKEKVEQVYVDKTIQETVLKVGKAIGGMADEDSLNDERYVDNLADLAIAVGPHMTLLEKLQEVNELGDQATLELLLSVFSDARIASEASLGTIAKLRVQVIDVLTNCINKTLEPPDEAILQRLIELSPWLLYPKWNVISANKTFARFRENLEGWWRRVYSEDLETTSIKMVENKRPDFILIHYHEGILIVEIKKPGKAMKNDDAERFIRYLDGMEKFFEAHKEYAKEIGMFQAVLVCDLYDLSPEWDKSLSYYEEIGILKKITWTRVLKDTQAVHADFIAAWEALQKLERERVSGIVEEEATSEDLDLRHVRGATDFLADASDASAENVDEEG